jgi:carbonic anhydrase
MYLAAVMVVAAAALSMISIAVAADAEMQEQQQQQQQQLLRANTPPRLQSWPPSYRAMPTATDYMSWTYDDSKKGDANGVCSPTNKCGPSTWKNIQAVAPTVNSCGGKYQTPVNIQPLDVVNNATLSYPVLTVTGGGCSSWTQFTTDNVFQFSFMEAGNTCTNFKATWGGTTWTLMQAHTHSPSSHTFGGSYYDAELHLAHGSPDGRYLVLTINFIADNGVITTGSGHAILTTLWNAAVAQYTTESGGSAAPSAATAASYQWTVTSPTPVDFYRGFLPPDKTYYVYTGSLTNYPCTEGVISIVFKQPVRISKNDLAILRGAVKANPTHLLDPDGNNIRPVQPLNGRKIQRFAN